MFLTGNFGHEEERFSYALETVASHPYKPAIYIFSLCAFAALIGFVAHAAVRYWHLDHRFRFLRFTNEWFYWLKAEITKFSETDDVDGEHIGTVLSAVVHHKEDYLYTGIVIDHFFDTNGNLDRVILEQVSRRKLCNDKGMAEDDEPIRYYPIDCNYMVLRYSEMVTISLRYLTVVQSTPVVGPHQLAKSEIATLGARIGKFLLKLIAPQD